jgi:hypothetical protein
MPRPNSNVGYANSNIPLATRPHVSRLWPTCGAVLVYSLRNTCADATRPRRRAIDPAAYRTALFAGSKRSHCGPPALAMPITLMTAPSVITPRSANPLRKAKQLSGTATASNKSRFMTKCVCLWLRPPTNSSPRRRSDNAVQKIVGKLHSPALHGTEDRGGLSRAPEDFA